MGRNDSGKGWVTVNRAAQKDAEREERRLRKKEEREAEERAAAGIGGSIIGASSGYDWINGPAGGFLAHIGAAAGKAQAQDRNVVDVPPPAAAATAAAAVLGNTAAAKKLRAAEEKEAAAKEAAARKKKQEAAQRHARLNDRSTWPSVTERLLEIAATLGTELDALHTDSITADKEALRLHYAIATVQRAVGDRVASWESTTEDEEVEEDGACAESMASVLEPLCAVERDGAFARDVSGRDLLQALDAHGRASTSAAAVLEAVQNAYFAIQPALPEAGAATRSAAARLAVQAVLRASAWVVAANLGAVVDHFTPRVCHPTQGLRSDKPAKAAPSHMDFILRLVLQYVAATPDGQGSEYGVLRAGISKFLNALAALGSGHPAVPVLLHAATPFLRGAASWLHEAEAADEVVMDDEALGRKYVKAPALHPDAAQLLLGATQLETGVRMVLLRELGLYASRAGAGAITSRLVRLAGATDDDEAASIAATAAAVFAASGLRTAIDAAALCLSTAPAGLARTLAAMPKGQIPADLATAIATRGKELVDGKAAALPAKRVAEVNEVVRTAASMKRVATVATAVPAPARASAAPAAAAAAAPSVATAGAAAKNGKKNGAAAAAAAAAPAAAPVKGTVTAKKSASTAPTAAGKGAKQVGVEVTEKSSSSSVGTVLAVAVAAAVAAAAFVAHSSGVF